MKKLLCKIFGHKLIENGIAYKEWTNQGRYIMNYVKPPIKMRKLICKRCKTEYVEEIWRLKK